MVNWTYYRGRLLRGRLLPSALAFVLLGLIVPARGWSAEGEAPGAVVKANDLVKFDPEEVSVDAGDTVEWRSVSVMVHTVTADPAKAAMAEDVALPPGAKAFDSGNIEPNGVFRHRFDVPGTYRYFCVPHEGARMVGTVICRAAAGERHGPTRWRSKAAYPGLGERARGWAPRGGEQGG